MALVRKIRELEKALEAAQHTDALTGLANKTRMYEEIEHHLSLLKREHEDGHNQFSVIFIDLDNFKPLNDKSHLLGDHLLIGFADFLKAMTRESDLVARFGGDEFWILAAETDLKQARALCAKIKNALKQFMFGADGRSFILEASFGASSTSEEILDPMKLIEAADTRMQEEKAKNKKGRSR